MQNILMRLQQALPQAPYTMSRRLYLQMYPRVHLHMGPRTYTKCVNLAAQNAKEGSDVSFNIKILQ